MTALTNEEFIDKAKKKHGDKYDYSLCVYRGAKYPVKLVCQVHGIFEQEASNHTQGKGCRKCGMIVGRLPVTKTKDDFILAATKIHGDKYDYSLVKYTRSQDKVQIICPTHNIFESSPNNHTRGKGCPRCGEKNVGKILSLSLEEFLSRFNAKFGNFPFKIVPEFTSLTSPMFVEDMGLNLYKTTGQNLLTTGKLTIQSAVDKNAYSIKRFRLVHGDKYNYDNLEYVNADAKVTVNCTLHGDFKISPAHHLSGQGCTKCGNLRSGLSRKGIPSTGWGATSWAESKERSSKFDSFKVYFVKLEDGQEQFYKIGRTFYLVSERMKAIPYNYEIIHTISHDDPKVIFDLENYLERTFKPYKYKPLKPFGGQHECFTFTPDLIESVLREMEITLTSDNITTSS